MEHTDECKYTGGATWLSLIELSIKVSVMAVVSNLIAYKQKSQIS